MGRDYKIKILKNGKKRYVKDISLGTRVDGSRKRTTLTASTLKELREKESQLRLNNDMSVVDRTLTLEDAFNAFLKDCKNRLAYSTYYNRKCRYEAHLKKYGSLKLKSFDTKTVNEIIRNIDSSLAPNSRNAIINDLRTFFNFCHRNKMITDNPFNNIQTATVKQKEMHYWTEEQFNAFISTVGDEYRRLVYTTAFYTGLRKGELFGLYFDDIEDGLITVRHQYKRGENGSEISDVLKTSSSYRIVPLPSFVEIGEGEGLIFYRGYMHIAEYFRRDQSRAGLDIPELHFHELRHSYASLLISKGVDIYTVSKMMGHSNIQMTASRYAHLYTDTYREVASLLEKKE